MKIFKERFLFSRKKHSLKKFDLNWKNLTKIPRKYRVIMALLLLSVAAFAYIQARPVVAKKVLKNNIKMHKKDFKSGEKIEVEIGNFSTENLKVVLLVNDKEIEIDYERKDGKFYIKPPKHFKPGRYKIIVRDGKEDLFTKDLTWGVMAINANKTIYTPGETAKFSYALLDNTGEMICNANLILVIKDKDGKVLEEQSNENGKIKINDQCSLKTLSETPDYESEYMFAAVGVYTLELKSTIYGEERKLIDSIEVRDYVEMDVERQTATRIYPVLSYSVKLNVIANQDFKGKVSEIVPNVFEIKELEDVKKYSDVKDNNDDTKKIIWDLDVKKGDKFTLGYLYDAPDISPEYYTLGPARFYSPSKVIDLVLDSDNNTQENAQKVSEKESIAFEEVRKWQIASDAISRLQDIGFELRSKTALVEFDSLVGTANLSISSAPVHSGLYALGVNNTSSQAAGIFHTVRTSGTSKVYFRSYILATTEPSTLATIMCWANISGNCGATVRLNTNMTLELWQGSATAQIGNDSMALNLNQWYRVEMTYDDAAADNKTEGFLNGELFASGTGHNLGNGSIISIGILSNAVGNVYFDDLALDTGQSVGIGMQGHLYPNAAGDNALWFRGGATNSGANFSQVNESPPFDDGLSFVGTTQQVGNRIDDYNVTNSSVLGIGSSDTINLVAVGVRAASTTNVANTANVIALRIKGQASGTVTTSTTQLINLAATAYTTHRNASPRIYDLVQLTNPQSGAAWTSTSLDSMQIGIIRPHTASTAQIRVSGLWALVDWIPKIIVSGTVFNVGTTTFSSAVCGGDHEISLRSSGSSYSTTCDPSTGLFVFNDVAKPENGEGLFMYIKGHSTDGAAVTRYDGSGNSTDNIIYTNALTLSSDNSAPVTNALLDTYDSAFDAELPYGVTSSGLSVNSGFTLVVRKQSGVTAGSPGYDPGGTVVTHTTGGDLQVGESAVAEFDTSANQIGRDLLMGAGATFNINATTTILGGDATGNGIVSYSTGTPTTTLMGNGFLGGNSTWKFYNLTLGIGTANSTSANGTGGMIVDGVLTIGTSQTLHGGTKLWTFTASGTPFVKSNSTFTPGTSTFSFEGSSATTIPLATYYNLFASPTSGSPTYTVASNGGSGSWYESGWIYRKAITIDETKVSGTTELANFPVYVGISSDSDLASDAQDDGDDILFTSADGTTKLNHEIEKFDGATGQLDAFVKIPTLDFDSNTVVYMYYGHGTTSNQQNPTAVWDSNFMGVWHFLETSGSQFDSTSNNNDFGTFANLASQGGAAGKINGANDYEFGSDSSVTGIDSASLDATATWTAESWIKLESIPGAGVFYTILYKGNQPNYFMQIRDSGDIDVGFHDGTSFVSAVSSGNDAGTTGVFYYIAATFDNVANTIKGYVNATEQSSNTSAAGNPQTANGIVLGDNTFNERFDGIIDELRLSNIVRTTDWITTTNNNISAPSTFISIGSEGTDTGGTAGTVTVNNNFSTTGPGAVLFDNETNDAIFDVNNNFTIAAGDTFQASSSAPLTIAGDYLNNGIFVAGSGSVTMDAGTTEHTLAGSMTGPSSFYDIIFSNVSGGWSFGANPAKATDDFTISSGRVTAPSTTLDIGGNYSNAGTFYHNNGTVTMVDTTAATLSGAMTGNSSFYNITFNGSGGVFGFATNPVKAANNFTITNGSITAPSTSLTVSQNFTNNGTFAHNSGTVIFDDNTKTSQLTYSAGITFQNLTVVTGGKAMQFDETDRTNVAGDANFQGTDCTTGRIFLDSTTNDNQWDFRVLGTGKTFNYVDVEDSNAIASLTASFATADNNNNTNWTINPCNQSPTAPSNLTQINNTTSAIVATGGWINETTIKISATASDQDTSDTVRICAEVDGLSTSFSNIDDACGAGVAYSGTPVTVSVTIPNLTSGTEYHWQARIRDAASDTSPWVSYGGNAESARDFSVDTSSPTGGTVYDGTAPSVDAIFNSGSLSVIGANWTAFDSATAGIAQYDYSAGTGPGETSIVSWTNAGTGLSVNVTGLTLKTSQTYYFNVRAIDNAGNTSPVVSSDGQQILPTLSFSISPSTLTFNNINAANSYSDTQPTTLTVSTNAYNGYLIRAYTTSLLRGVGDSAVTIQNFSGGTYASPDGWQVGDTGFGYNSSDTLVQGVNIFNSNPCPGGNGTFCYAPFSQNAPGDIVADHTSVVAGNPISSEQTTITSRVTASSTQAAMPYTTTVIYTITAIY